MPSDARSRHQTSRNDSSLASPYRRHQSPVGGRHCPQFSTYPRYIGLQPVWWLAYLFGSEQLSTENTKTSKPKVATKAEARSNAAESERLEAKAARIQSVLAEARKREAELTAKGYFF